MNRWLSSMQWLRDADGEKIMEKAHLFLQSWPKSDIYAKGKELIIFDPVTPSYKSTVKK